MKPIYLGMCCITLLLPNALHAARGVDIAFHGRLQLDSHNFTLSKQASSNEVDSVSEVRRARVENIGNFYDTFKYKISAELSSKKSVLEDVYVSLLGDSLRLVLGQFYYPFGNETQGSSKHSEFMEKASITSLVSYGRDRGISVQTYRSRFLFLQLGVVQGAGANTADNNSDLDKVIRFGLDSNLHDWHKTRFLLGFSAATGKQLAREGDSIKIKSESHSDLTLFKAAIPESTEYRRGRFALESIYLDGPWMFKPEFFYDHYRFDTSVHILGYYLTGSYFFTGEQRSLKNGLLSRQKIFRPITRNGWGAWELALRYSSYMVDPEFYENDSLFVGWQGMSGEKYPNRGMSFTSGLNWYAHSHIRLMLNNVMTYTKSPGDDAYQRREYSWIFRVQGDF